MPSNESSATASGRTLKSRLRVAVVYGMLLALKTVTRFFYRPIPSWINGSEDRDWSRIRVVAFLNHTSLFEWLYAGIVPNSLLRNIATRGVVPAADKTIRRPIVGRFYRLIARDVVAISRERDQTWDEVLAHLQRDSMIIILPEGRMRRRTGLDSQGRKMTVRGGIADILARIDEGEMLIAYAGGLHHVQAPGERLPRLFKTIRMAFEAVDIPTYRARRAAEARKTRGFKQAVVADLERRRDLHCPIEEDTTVPTPETAA